MEVEQIHVQHSSSGRPGLAPFRGFTCPGSNGSVSHDVHAFFGMLFQQNVSIYEIILIQMLPYKKHLILAFSSSGTSPRNAQRELLQ